MRNKDFNWKDYHHQIYQIYHGMIALTLVPFALLFLEWDTNTAAVVYSSPLFILTLQLSWIIGFASWYAWKGERVQYVLEEGMSLDNKLKEFKKRNLYKYFMLAIAGMVACFAMWLQPFFLFVVAYFAVLIQYSFLRPSEDKIVRDMRLTKEDRKKLHEEA
jgi:prepilin signal peptidase PulO-like enzyme (type II secretory pathway)